MFAEPQVLRPYTRAEAIPVAEAARIAGRSVRTMREWCLRHDLGRRIGGQWAVSKIALAMHLDGNKEAVAAYLAGDRSSPIVTEYFERFGVTLPRPSGSEGVTSSHLSSLPGRSIIGTKWEA
jgi:hypothetical protein